MMTTMSIRKSGWKPCMITFLCVCFVFFVRFVTLHCAHQELRDSVFGMKQTLGRFRTDVSQIQEEMFSALQQQTLPLVAALKQRGVFFCLISLFVDADFVCLFVCLFVLFVYLFVCLFSVFGRDRSCSVAPVV